MRVVVSTAELSWPDNENRMTYITDKCRQCPHLLKMGCFDFAGSGSSATASDKPRWDRLFGSERQPGPGLIAVWEKVGLDTRGAEYEAVRDELWATDWYATYKGLVIGSLKAAIMESPTGTVVSLATHSRRQPWDTRWQLLRSLKPVLNSTFNITGGKTFYLGEYKVSKSDKNTHEQTLHCRR